MLRLQWNALQVGDKVLVHDDADISLRLHPGTVVMVQTAHGSNDLGVPRDGPVGPGQRGPAEPPVGPPRSSGCDRGVLALRRHRRENSERARGSCRECAVTRWEYLIVSLPDFEPAKSMQGGSASVARLNREGAEGWEALGMTELPDGHFAVLLKRPLDD